MKNLCLCENSTKNENLSEAYYPRPQEFTGRSVEANCSFQFSFRSGKDEKCSKNYKKLTWDNSETQFEGAVVKLEKRWKRKKLEMKSEGEGGWEEGLAGGAQEFTARCIWNTNNKEIQTQMQTQTQMQIQTQIQIKREGGPS